MRYRSSGPPPSEKRVLIEGILTRYAERRRKGGKFVYGMAKKVAERFGVSRQRVSNIAIALGVNLRK